MVKLAQLFLVTLLAATFTVAPAKTLAESAREDVHSLEDKHPVVGNPAKKIKLHDLISNFIFSMKGFVLGFQQGLLKNERIRLSDKCFGTDEVNANLVFLSEFATFRRPIWEVVKFTTTATDMIIDEMVNC